MSRLVIAFMVFAVLALRPAVGQVQGAAGSVHVETGPVANPGGVNSTLNSNSLGGSTLNNVERSEGLGGTHSAQSVVVTPSPSDEQPEGHAHAHSNETSPPTDEPPSTVNAGEATTAPTDSATDDSSTAEPPSEQQPQSAQGPPWGWIALVVILLIGVVAWLSRLGKR